jgi:alginate biosynthesis protein Alg44
MEIETLQVASHAALRDREPATSPPLPLDAGNDHPSVTLPFTAIIDGRTFSGAGLSLIKAEVAGLAGPDLAGKRRIAILRFDLEGYSVSLPVEVQISWTDQEKGLLRLDFVDPTASHLSILRYFINAHIAGDIVSVDRLLSVRDKPMGSNMRKTGSGRSLIRSGIKGIVATTAGLLLLGVVAELAYARLFTSDVPQLARVAVIGDNLRALANGQISYLNTTAKKGEVVYSLNAVSGSTINVTLPCVCSVSLAGVREGSTVLAGERVVELSSGPAQPIVIATMAPELAKMLLKGDIAWLRFTDGRQFSATLVDGPDAVTEDPEGGGAVTLRLLPSEPLPASAVGAPVSVTIINPTIDALRHEVFAFADRLGLSV